MKKRAIPLIDLSKFTRGSFARRNEFVQDLGRAFHEIGFVGVVNHGIDKKLIEEFYAASNSFFSLPLEVKRKYEVPGLAGQRGYTSFGKEHARESNTGDLKEFFQIGQELEASSMPPKDYPPNIRVAEIPEFLQLGCQLFQAFENAGAQLLKAIALHLDIGPDYFDKKIQYGNSILRAIYYPPLMQEPDNAVRAGQHEDINLITLLVGASAGGLQVLSKDGQWLDVVPEEDEIVINVGDMLQRLTNNHLKSTTHRVVNPPREEWHKPRLSIPFFLHPRSDMNIACLPNCIRPSHPAAYSSITAGRYLDERLREIGLK